MELRTDRLSLVPMAGDDLECFHKTNINPFVKQFLWDDEVIPESVSSDILNEVVLMFKKNKWGLWKILNIENGNYMGYIGLWCFFDEKQPQLLYALLPEYIGNGYATEASEKIINYAFNTLNFEYLIAAMDPSNQASIAVCRRLNMVLVKEKEVEGKPTLFYRLENIG
ncbi:MAG: GNAT family N-acetyltransferase [Chitinophagales bacterium]|nr:GNAT family N-acetyltransferase [Chitinophagales bacterium]